MDKVALVTGSSSGIGFETALELGRNGYHTYATMRDISKGSKILEIAKKENLKIKVIELDVNDDQSIKNAVKKILDENKRLDLLVNNAGYFLVGCLEDMTEKDLKDQFETNFFGVVRIIQSVLPTMRNQKSGTIVNVSSVAGRIGFPVTPGYISSKFALEGLSESMRYELAPFGIKTIIIEPGVVKTNLFTTLKKATKADPAYKDITQKVLSGLIMMSQMGTQPQEVASTIVKAVSSDNPLPRYPVGNDAAMFLEAKKVKTDIEFENYIKKELFS
ncbi:putative short chain dehydrogenase [Nitrosotalea sinensis]|uniref:Putative short chain dehydrogenase n=1 Tax=Nitrosotalea sinensis TaxID=1499975 RepID=A0A2H1EGB0_9ARCH|nr:SDR family oxidoreductase [Candidatus Nitrosotalea sinensis]SHO45214.1 putative short chain dehydrogenase [Candidatus Nitrosotalea sinensis]